jgi:hypothetical protein
MALPWRALALNLLLTPPLNLLPEGLRRRLLRVLDLHGEVAAPSPPSPFWNEPRVYFEGTTESWPCSDMLVVEVQGRGMVRLAALKVGDVVLRLPYQTHPGVPRRVLHIGRERPRIWH